MTIHIYDFEDGLQDFIADRLDCDTDTFKWDYRGRFNFKTLKPASRNIVILSKPYDCLQRSYLMGKYPDDDFHKVQDWSRRNWRYSSPEIYDEMNKFISVIEYKLILHPEELNDKVTIKRIEKFTKSKFNWDVSEFDEFFKNNINLR